MPKGASKRWKQTARSNMSLHCVGAKTRFNIGETKRQLLFLRGCFRVVGAQQSEFAKLVTLLVPFPATVARAKATTQTLFDHVFRPAQYIFTDTCDMYLASSALQIVQNLSQSVQDILNPVPNSPFRNL